MHLLSFTAVKPIKIQIMSPPPLIFRPSYGPVKQSQVEDGKLQQVVFWSWPNKTVASNAWAIPQKLEFSVNPITYLFSGWSFLMIIALYRLFLPSRTQFGQKDIALPEKKLCKFKKPPTTITHTQTLLAKFCIPSTLNTDLIIWHWQWIKNQIPV